MKQPQKFQLILVSVDVINKTGVLEKEARDVIKPQLVHAAYWNNRLLAFVDLPYPNIGNPWAPFCRNKEYDLRDHAIFARALGKSKIEYDAWIFGVGEQDVDEKYWLRFVGAELEWESHNANHKEDALKVLSPLQSRAYMKQRLYDTADLVWSCRNPRDGQRCGECFQCKTDK